MNARLRVALVFLCTTLTNVAALLVSTLPVVGFGVAVFGVGLCWLVSQ